MSIILAHGALGNWDEVIFIGIAAIFFIMMIVSWIKSRNTRPDLGERELRANGGKESGNRFPME
jgi:hypothetical protein